MLIQNCVGQKTSGYPRTDSQILFLKMAEILDKSEKDFKEVKDLLEECTKGFIACMKFYKFTPKKGKVEDAKPEEFFSIWFPFCEDFKNIWKKEQVRYSTGTVKCFDCPKNDLKGLSSQL